MRRAVALTVMVFGLFHIVMTALYLAPPNLPRNAVQGWMVRYMEPLFLQNWHLFSPNPGIAYSELWVRCQTSAGDWTVWMDPFYKLKQEHNSNRFTGRGKLLYVYKDIPRGLNEAYSLQKKMHCESASPCVKEQLMEEVKSNPYYETAARFTSDFCKAAAETQMVQFKVMTFFPKKFSERNTAGKWSAIEEMIYPMARTPGAKALSSIGPSR